MALNGIDTSNWQSGIDLDVVPYDFVIAKATQGKTYVSPDCARQVEQARARGKLFGVYHYIDGSGAIGEADFFIDSVENWVGEGILCLDWESNQNAAWGNEDYLRQVAQRVIDRTGIPPIIYVQKSRMAQVKKVADALNCGLWIAQYADMNTTGYQDAPWNEGAYSCAIRQYSSCGRLSEGVHGLRCVEEVREPQRRSFSRRRDRHRFRRLLRLFFHFWLWGRDALRLHPRPRVPRPEERAQRRRQRGVLWHPLQRGSGLHQPHL